MTMKSNFFLMAIVCLLSGAASNAQVSGTTVSVAGTPYIDEAFVDGEILFGNKNQSAPVRYNAFRDKMEYKQNGQPLELAASETIKHVRFGATTFVVQLFEFKGKTKFGFLAVLDSGKATLFAKKVIIYQEGLKGRALDGTDLPPTYKRVPDVFYFRVGNGELKEVESIKEMIAAFPDKQEELTQFAKKEKVSPRKEQTLVQLVQYYNSL